MNEQWGAPLTGAQMKVLTAAGLPDGTESQFFGWRSGRWLSRQICGSNFSAEKHRLPANHPAYTLLKFGWLDGRNVRLWFGGEDAPDDWDGTAGVIFRDGTVSALGQSWHWRHTGSGGDIIAYIAKDKVAEQPETVTIAKMTPDEIMERFRIPADEHHRSAFGRGGWIVLSLLGLIKEQTREERFWALHEPEGTTVPTHIKKLVKDALEFER